MSTTKGFPRSWHRVGEHSRAWWEPDGGWGRANVGPIADQGHGLQVDALFDLGHGPSTWRDRRAGRDRMLTRSRCPSQLTGWATSNCHRTSSHARR